MTTSQLLQYSNISTEKKEILLCYFLKCTKNDLFLNSHKEINKNIANKYKKAIKKIQNDYPLQYITHNQYFAGYDFWVNKNVLIPREETTKIVEYILSNIQNKDNISILEIGTGSGCIAISLAKKLKYLNIKYKIIAADISKKALYVAEKNYKKLQAQNIRFIYSDLFNKINLKKHYDFIVSNPPYVKIINPNIRFEPKIALLGTGNLGIDILEKIMNQLSYISFTHCILEMDADQTKIINKKYRNIYEINIIKDYLGVNRFIVIKHKNPMKNQQKI